MTSFGHHFVNYLGDISIAFNFTSNIHNVYFKKSFLQNAPQESKIAEIMLVSLHRDFGILTQK